MGCQHHYTTFIQPDLPASCSFCRNPTRPLSLKFEPIKGVMDIRSLFVVHIVLISLFLHQEWPKWNWIETSWRSWQSKVPLLLHPLGWKGRRWTRVHQRKLRKNSPTPLAPFLWAGCLPLYSLTLSSGWWMWKFLSDPHQPAKTRSVKAQLWRCP